MIVLAYITIFCSMSCAGAMIFLPDWGRDFCMRLTPSKMGKRFYSNRGRFFYRVYGLICVLVGIWLFTNINAK